ncbi:MAG: hypothetical protein L0J79_01335, partial [Propionibacterium sp.]|nr:hypothetical protein [Propionibacterium sp.]
VGTEPVDGEETSPGRPTRRSGATVVLVDGRAVLWLPRGGRDVLAFSADAENLRAAAGALVEALRAAGLIPFAVETVSGEPLRRTPMESVLRAVGFSLTPSGARLYW